jgi:hypothetical protein
VPLHGGRVSTDFACMDEQDCADALDDMYDVYVCMQK